MPQPKWKEIASADYFRVLEDTTGVYPEEAEIAQEIDEQPDEQGGTFQVFRIVLDRCKVVSGHLVSERYNSSWSHPVADYEEWFARDLGAVAQSIGAKKSDLIQDLCSADPMRRFSAYEAIGGYHGFNNFDDYPLQMTGDELDERWS